jgi:hypothetical protein
MVVIGPGRTLAASSVVQNGTVDVAAGRVASGPAEVRDFGTLRVSGATGRWVGGDLDTTGASGIGAPRIEVQSGADVSTLATQLATDSGERADGGPSRGSRRHRDDAPLGARVAPHRPGGLRPTGGRPHRDDRWRPRHARRREGRGLDLPRLVEGAYWDASDLYVTGVIRVIAGIPGDFDADGDVEGRAFLIWQRGGSPKALSDSDLRLASELRVEHATSGEHRRAGARCAGAGLRWLGSCSPRKTRLTERGYIC